MRKFLILCACLVIGYMGIHYIYYNTTIPFSLQAEDTLRVQARADGKNLYVQKDSGWEKLTICGMNLGSAIPGHFASDFAIDYDTYMNWFDLMQEMNVNVLRVYTIQSDTFYHAFYDYNEGRKNPLYLMHSVPVDDYSLRSHLDAFSPEVHDTFISDCKKLVDIIHGQKRIRFNSNYGSGTYKWDISPYVIGYILGSEWDPDFIIYTNEKQDHITSYRGTYFSTTNGATPFECFLAEVGDEVMEYEESKYNAQRLVAFSNWSETDPLRHQTWAASAMNNHTRLDIEHILLEDTVKSGTFASYHVYPYYPPFLNYETRFLKNGEENSYRTYLKALNCHHRGKPVVIAEYGLPTSRGIAQTDQIRGLDQGNLTEEAQGKGLRMLFEDIMESGCAGGMVFTWQDEWSNRTWNTLATVDTTRVPYWSDVQTADQMFGILAFEPGKTTTLSYPDGDLSEWKDTDPIAKARGMSLSMMYDERYLYLRVHKENLEPAEDTLYIPLDTTPKSGAYKDTTNHLSYDKGVDFVILIEGKNKADLLVQEYYNTTETLYGKNIHQTDPYLDPPAPDSGEFDDARQFLQYRIQLSSQETLPAEVFPSGKLIHGNGNPESEDYNSLADYYIHGDDIELRIPWGLLNFSDPSAMKIHGDYYEHYGVENLSIDHLNVALCVRSEGTVRKTGFHRFALEGWGETPTWHQRLKKSYTWLQDIYGRCLEKED